MAFRERLREQIEYCGLLDKEVAARGGYLQQKSVAKQSGFIERSIVRELVSAAN